MRISGPIRNRLIAIALRYDGEPYRVDTSPDYLEENNSLAHHANEVEQCCYLTELTRQFILV